MNPITSLVERLQRLVTQPAQEMTRFQKTVVFTYDLTRFCTRQLRRDRASQMAAALTYRTIFGLIPTIVMSMLLFRSFVSVDEGRTWLQKHVYEYLNIESLSAHQMAAAEESRRDRAPRAATEPSDTQPGEQPRLRHTVDDRIGRIIDNVYSVSLGKVGSIGLLLLIWASIGMIVTVEECFNTVCECPRGRPWYLRISIYCTLLVVGPVLLFASLWLVNWLIVRASGVGVVGPIVQWLSHFTALGATWLLLLVLYLWMPNTRIKLRPALIGSLVAAILWEIAKGGFRLYVVRALNYSAIYGALGLIPLFLFWIYLSWLIVLFGMELTFTLQSLRGRRLAEQEQRQERRLVGDPLWIMPIMVQVARAFGKGETVGTPELARALFLPERAVAELVDRLEEAKLIRRVAENSPEGGGIAATGAGSLTLAMPAEQLPVSRILEVAQGLTFGDAIQKGRPGWAYLDKLSNAQRVAAKDATLATLVKEEAGS